jgi:uncharacterized protein
MPARITRGAGYVRFGVRLTPKGGRDALDGWISISADETYLKARVRPAPEDGKANAALIVLLAKALGVPKSAIRLVSGATSRMKIIEIQDDSDKTAVRLENLGDT